MTATSANDKVDQELLVRYELVGDRLGEGAYGIVWKAIDRKSGEIIALKKVFDAFQNATDAQRTFREIMYLQALDHENIIKLFNVMKASNNKDIYLVFEFMETDLRSVIPTNILRPIHKACVIYQCLKALKYIHSAGLIHRDLKPANILLDSNCAVKICDFGLARSYIKKKGEESKRKVLTDYIATRWYRAPEILLGSAYYTTGVDIWSMGCIIAEIIGGKPMFRGTTTYHQLHKIIGVLGYPDEEDIQVLKTQHAITMLESIELSKQKQQRRNMEDLFPEAPMEAIDLLRKMLRFNPNKRISVEEALSHPFLDSFRKSEEQPRAPKYIEICLDDDVKYDVDHYRNELYERISERKRQIRKMLIERRKEKERAKQKKKDILPVPPCSLISSSVITDTTHTTNTITNPPITNPPEKNRRPSFQYTFSSDNPESTVSKRRLSIQPSSATSESDMVDSPKISKSLLQRTPSSQFVSFQPKQGELKTSCSVSKIPIPTDTRSILQSKPVQSSFSRPYHKPIIKPRPASTQSRRLSYTPNTKISTPTSTKSIIQKTPTTSTSAKPQPKKLPQWSSSSSIRRPSSTKSILKTKYPTASKLYTQSSSNISESASFMNSKNTKDKSKPTQQLPQIFGDDPPMGITRHHSFSSKLHRKVSFTQKLR